MKLIRDLQRDILNESVSLSSALRKAMVAAAKIRNPEFKAWVESELNGYESSPLELPPYRVIVTASFGTFTGPFGSGVRNQVIPVHHLPETLRVYATRMRFGDGVRELEALAKSGDYQRRWQAEAVQLANHYLQTDYVLVDAFQPITTAALEGILDAIRNRLLEFLLELQELDPEVLDNEDALGELPKDKVASTFSLTFYGNQNVIAAAASGGSVSQQVYQPIHPGDEDGLRQHLKSLGIADADVAELATALSQDGPPEEKGKFGSRVKRWIGGMTEKVLDGSWKVALETAPSLLTKALSAYYGWSKE